MGPLMQSTAHGQELRKGLLHDGVGGEAGCWAAGLVSV